MKIYIYKDVSPVSTSWHDGGGVIITTDRTPQEAWTQYWDDVIIKNRDDSFYKEKYIEIQKSVLGDADKVYETNANEEQVIIFEDAGCC